MKLRNVIELLGYKPRPREYGIEVGYFEHPTEGRIEVARWLHPGDYKKEFTAEHLADLRHFIHPGDVVLDIGAHSGDTSLPFAFAAGPTGQVLAFEPNPNVYKVLEANSRLNVGRTNILPLPFAASAEDGPLVFRYSDPGYCNGGTHGGISRWKHGHAYKLTVQGKNLWQWLNREMPAAIPRIRFIKVDAEGYDLTVLKTLQPLLAKYQPAIQVEFYKHLSPSQRHEMLNFLKSQGYQVRHYRHEGDMANSPAISSENIILSGPFDAICHAA